LGEGVSVGRRLQASSHKKAIKILSGKNVFRSIRHIKKIEIKRSTLKRRKSIMVTRESEGNQIMEGDSSEEGKEHQKSGHEGEY